MEITMYLKMAIFFNISQISLTLFLQKTARFSYLISYAICCHIIFSIFIRIYSLWGDSLRYIFVDSGKPH